MRFMHFSLLAMASAVLAAPPAPKAACGSFFYVEKATLEPCASECGGGRCELTPNCPSDPIILCGAYCRC